MSPPLAPVDPLTGLSAARLGIYVHFPYCLSKCPYCDFASTAAREVPEERYARAVLRELALRVGDGRPVAQSVYFGGGTPSLWRPELVGRVLEGLRTRVRLEEGAEVTLEANPGAADAGRFAGYRAAGVNRLSIGVQSFHPATLRALGREHDGPMAVRAFEAARAAGFDNVSLDFIYGVHGQSVEQAVADATGAAALGPEHLSAYALTLDREALAEEVPLARQLARGEVQLPPDDQVLEMAQRVRDVWAGVGLERYEISNYARPGFHSRHNAAYWTGGEYLALGSGATGFLRQPDRAERYSNHRSADAYLAAVEEERLPERSREPLDSRELFSERVAMGLRLTEGVDLDAACTQFGMPLGPRRAEAERLEKHGFLARRGSRIRLTDRGMALHTEVASRFL